MFLLYLLGALRGDHSRSHDLESPAHNPFHNVAFIAVYRREWATVAAWLHAETVWQYPEPDMEAMMRGLARWQARDFWPLGPERAELGYPPE